MRLPRGITIGFVSGSITAGIVTVLVFTQIGSILFNTPTTASSAATSSSSTPVDSGNNMINGYYSSSINSAQQQSGPYSQSSIANGIINPIQHVHTREPLGSDTFVLPANDGTKQVIFFTKPADNTLLIGGATITGDDYMEIKVSLPDGSCPPTPTSNSASSSTDGNSCPQLTIHGSGSVLAAVTTTTTSPSSSTTSGGNEISLQVPSDQTLELSFTNKSQQPQTVSYYLVLDYERAVRGN